MPVFKANINIICRFRNAIINDWKTNDYVFRVRDSSKSSSRSFARIR